MRNATEQRRSCIPEPKFKLKLSSVQTVEFRAITAAPGIHFNRLFKWNSFQLSFLFWNSAVALELSTCIYVQCGSMSVEKISGAAVVRSLFSYHILPLSFHRFRKGVSLVGLHLQWPWLHSNQFRSFPSNPRHKHIIIVTSSFSHVVRVWVCEKVWGSVSNIKYKVQSQYFIHCHFLFSRIVYSSLILYNRYISVHPSIYQTKH